MIKLKIEEEDFQEVDSYTYDVEIIHNWSLYTKKSFENFRNYIDKFKFENSWFKAYTWCDISSYEYWKNSSWDMNYVILTIIQKKSSTLNRNKFINKFIEDTKTKFVNKLTILKSN